MKIILKKDIDNLGLTHEVVDVKSGYARNYLIPKKIAVEANVSNLKHLESIKKGQKILEQRLLEDIKGLVEKMKETPVILKAKTGTSGKIFGNITTAQISREIKEQKGFILDRKKISIPEDIKTLGVYHIHVNFENGIEHDFNIEIVSED